jgi:hypothetical protein
MEFSEDILPTCCRSSGDKNSWLLLTAVASGTRMEGHHLVLADIQRRVGDA